jgi:hypothetical protein
LLALLACLSLWVALITLLSLFTRLAGLTVFSLLSLLGCLGFGVHQFSSLLEALQRIPDFLAHLSGDGVVGISLSLCGLLGQLSSSIELIGSILSSLAGLLQLGLIEPLGRLLTTLSSLLSSLSSFAGWSGLILESERRVVESFSNIFQHLRNISGFVGDGLLWLLLGGDLRGTVLLHLAEGIRKAVEIIPLLS